MKMYANPNKASHKIGSTFFTSEINNFKNKNVIFFAKWQAICASNLKKVVSYFKEIYF